MNDFSSTYYEQLKKETINCPICTSADYKVVLNQDRYKMGLQTVICSYCGLIYINPRPTEAEMSSFYKNNYRNFYESVEVPTEDYIKNGPFIPRAKFVFSVLKPYLNDGTTILDVGCAEGTFLKLVESYNSSINTFGIEPSEGFGNYAKNQLKGSVFIGNYQEFSALNKKNSYDVIITTHVLEHILNPNEFLKTLKGFMHKDSILYIEVPNIMSDKLKGIGAIHIGHVLSLDIDTLRILLQKNDLEIIDTFLEGLPALTPSFSVVCKVNHNLKKLPYPTGYQIKQKQMLFKKRIVSGCNKPKTIILNRILSLIKRKFK